MTDHSDTQQREVPLLSLDKPHTDPMTGQDNSNWEEEFERKKKELERRRMELERLLEEKRKKAPPRPPNASPPIPRRHSPFTPSSDSSSGGAGPLMSCTLREQSVQNHDTATTISNSGHTMETHRFVAASGEVCFLLYVFT
jgi:hypothetical protein